jgi:excisionase family DNA binding protein
MRGDAVAEAVERAFPPLGVDVKGAAEMLGLSAGKVYQLIASGELFHRRVGRKILVPRKALEAFLEGRPYNPGGFA